MICSGDDVLEDDCAESLVLVFRPELDVEEPDVGAGFDQLEEAGDLAVDGDNLSL